MTVALNAAARTPIVTGMTASVVRPPSLPSTAVLDLFSIDTDISAPLDMPPYEYLTPNRPTQISDALLYK